MQGKNPRAIGAEGRKFLKRLGEIEVNGAPLVNVGRQKVFFSEAFFQYVRATLHPGRPRK
jgi:hypothetical protein